MERPSSVRGVFFNDHEGRLRTPWRLVLGGIVVVVFGVGAVVAASVLASVAPGVGASFAAVVETTAQLSVYVGFVLGVLLAAWLVDRRHLRDMGLDLSSDWWTDLAFGLVLGLVLPALAFSLLVAVGFARVAGTFVVREGATLPAMPAVGFGLAFALTAAYFVGVGVFEELVLRGYLLTNVAEGLRGIPRVGVRGALAVATVVTSFLFGLAHAANPGASLVAVGTITLYGVLFALAYLLTGQIAIPIGIHVTWNLAVSSVFGFPVSGVRTPATVIGVDVTGPDVVTGGVFGPEAGLVALVPLTVGMAAIVAWVRWRAGAVQIHESVAIPDVRTAGAEA